MEATNTIRDALTASIDPVYGLTTLHASLRAFHGEPHPVFSDEEVKSTVYAFGLIALGKFILRLPAEIAEEELPRLKGTLISVRSSTVSSKPTIDVMDILLVVAERYFVSDCSRIRCGIYYRCAARSSGRNSSFRFTRWTCGREEEPSDIPF